MVSFEDGRGTSSGSNTPSTPPSTTSLPPLVSTKYGCIEGIRTTIALNTGEQQEVDLFLAFTQDCDLLTLRALLS
uniref:Uncharacterized protein n=1 Tax=Ditylenchus dipsaci TaxID=166011 RepID=A0A915DPF5_9BILA